MIHLSARREDPASRKETALIHIVFESRSGQMIEVRSIESD
jgi:hypothetical protein